MKQRRKSVLRFCMKAIQILFLCMSIHSSVLADIRCILPSGIQHSIAVQQYQLLDYVSLAQLSKSVFPGCTYNPSKQTIQLKNATIICKSNSPIITLQYQHASLTSRLKNPPALISSELHVPFDQFVHALSNMGLITYKRLNSSDYQFGNYSDPSFSSTYDLPSIAVYNQEIPSATIPAQQANTIKLDEVYDFEIDEEALSKDRSNTSINDEILIKESNPLSTVNDNQNDLLVFSSNIDNTKKTKKETTYLQKLSTEAGIANSQNCAITSVSVEKSKNEISMLFTTNIESGKYQKPEFNGRELILRFPDTENSINSFSSLIDKDPIVSFNAEKVRTYLLFRIRLYSTIQNATIKKIGKNQFEVIIKYAEKQEQIKVTTADKGKWDLDVIVLDPGHGGEDAGAISINGYKEKDIALSIAKYVKELLKVTMPESKVVMTRNDDTFIELFKRGQIANQQKGKLFISIHCNSMPTKPHPAHGCESYILRPGRNSEAVRVAEKENSSIKLEKSPTYNDMSEENLIVATMAQSAFVKFSEKYAAILQKEASKSTSLFNRGVNQAGFLVLVGASMPNVLFETGFLSNMQDEKLLSSASGQQKIAEGIAKAIKRYAEEYIRKN